MKVLSLFSGIGAFEQALKNIGTKVEVVNYCEIDNYASKSYSLIHNVSEDKNLGDIAKVDETILKDFDLMTYGFPCQDLSIAGKKKGFEEGTRSNLLWEAMRIAEYKKPKIMIAENVKNLVGKSFKEDFDNWINYLESIGYKNYWKVLNAKDFGIPQNRERVFVISIREDINHKEYVFPEGKELSKSLSDLLETDVDEKYYIKAEISDKFFEKLNLENCLENPKALTERRTEKAKQQRKEHKAKTGKDSCPRRGKEVVPRKDDLANCVTATQGVEQKVIEPNVDVIGSIDINGHDNIKRVYNADKISPTLNSMTGGNRQPKVVVKNHGEWSEREKVNCIDANYHKGVDNHGQRTMVVAMRGRYNKDGKVEQQLEPNNTGNTNALTTVQKDNYLVNLQEAYRIRKLTPKECWRLMGFKDEDFNKCEKELSNTQLYKQAGNSIVVNVLEAIFKQFKKDK